MIIIINYQNYQAASTRPRAASAGATGLAARAREALDLRIPRPKNPSTQKSLDPKIPCPQNPNYTGLAARSRARAALRTTGRVASTTTALLWRRRCAQPCRSSFVSLSFPTCHFNAALQDLKVEIEKPEIYCSILNYSLWPGRGRGGAARFIVRFV